MVDFRRTTVSERNRGISRRGFSLVEILIASAIIVVALIPLFGVFKFSSRSTESMNNRSVAAKFARGICEEVVHQDFKLLADLMGPMALDISTPPSEGDLFPLTREEMEEDEFVDLFTATVALKPGDDNDHIQLSIEVSWEDIRGTGAEGAGEDVDRSVKLSRMIVNPKPMAWVMTGTGGTGTGTGTGDTDVDFDEGTGTGDESDEALEDGDYVFDDGGLTGEGIYGELDQYVRDNRSDPSQRETCFRLLELRGELQRAEREGNSGEAQRIEAEINEILHPPEDEDDGDDGDG